MNRLPRLLSLQGRRLSNLPPVPPNTNSNLNATTSSSTPVSPSATKQLASTSDRPKNLDETRVATVKALREWLGPAAATFRSYADQFTVSAKTTFSQLGSQLNKVTGYEEIEALKRRVVNQESRIKETRNVARQAKTAYEQAVSQRSNSQREVNDLLQRKSSWTDSDVSRFTTLVRQDHLYEQEEIRTKAAVEETEAAVEREFSELMRTILARYHEEQVWSDKIRSASTYGSLAALGLNLLVFIMAILVVEPWKRRRMAQTFEKKIEQLSQETASQVEERMGRIEQLLQAQTTLITSSVAADAKPVPIEAVGEPEINGTPTSDVEIQEQPPKSSSIIDVVLEKPEVQTALAASALIAGSIGWFIRAWFDR